MKQVIFDYENIGGLTEIFAIPPSVVKNIHKNYVTGLMDFDIIDLSDVIYIPVYANDTFQYSEEKTDTDAGSAWDVDIEGVIPKICHENDDVLQELEQGEWFVISVDYNGVIHLSGREDAPMTFKCKRGSGTSPSSRNGISFTFSCSQPYPSYIVSKLP